MQKVFKRKVLLRRVQSNSRTCDNTGLVEVAHHVWLYEECSACEYLLSYRVVTNNTPRQRQEYCQTLSQYTP
jgi:hypothetical protein